MDPAQLALLQEELVVIREAIDSHDPSQGVPQQIDRGDGRAAKAPCK